MIRFAPDRRDDNFRRLDGDEGEKMVVSLLRLFAPFYSEAIKMLPCPDCGRRMPWINYSAYWLCYCGVAVTANGERTSLIEIVGQSLDGQRAGNPQCPRCERYTQGGSCGLPGCPMRGRIAK